MENNNHNAPIQAYSTNILYICPKENILDKILSHAKFFCEGKTIFLFPAIDSSFDHNVIEKLLSIFKKSVLVQNSVSIKDRKQFYLDNTFILLSPSLLYNDILRKLIDIKEIKNIVIFKAEYAVGSHVLNKCIKLITNIQPKVRIISFSSYLFYQHEKLQEVCSNLRVMKITLSSKILNAIVDGLVRIIVPLPHHIFKLIIELNAIKEEYNQYFMKNKAINLNSTVSFGAVLDIMKKMSYENPVIKEKMHEYLIIVKTQRLLESDGIEPAIKFLERNIKQMLTAERDLKRTNILVDLKEELLELIEEGEHPKIKQLQYQIRKMINYYPHINVVVNNKDTAKMLEKNLKSSSEYTVLNLVGQKVKKRYDTVATLKNEKNVIFLTTKPLETCSLVMFYSVPEHYNTFLQALSMLERVMVFITHRSLEERVFYKFLKQLEKINEIVENPEIHQTLLQNQQEYFHKNIEEKFDMKTKAMISLLKNIEKIRANKVTNS